MLFRVVVISSLALALARAEPPKEPDHDPDVESFNYVLGTQTIGVRYQFTKKTRLVETAEAIHAMGSNILKICMGRRYSGADYSLPKRDSIRSLVDLASREPSFQAVFDMPFSHYLIWAYPFGAGRWTDGLSADEGEREFEEIYAFARYLLETYNGSGKTFLVGHWEGDWHLHENYDRTKDPAPVRIRGMIDWLNVRQKAIDRARRDTEHENVRIFHYTEVNLVQKAMEEGVSLTNNVLPQTRVDYVSYSCYDTINTVAESDLRRSLQKALDYIETKLPAKPGIRGKRVFIGEYGFPLERTKTAEKQRDLSRIVARAALEWGCPYVLYWEMYCNEIRDGKHRGFWLIDDQGRKQPAYTMHQRYYRRAKEYVASFKKRHDRLPSAEEFRTHAVELLSAP